MRESDFLIAYDTAREAVEEYHVRDIWMQQQMALALAQLGSIARARSILAALLEQESTNRETIGLLARTYKEEWYANRNNTKALECALQCYQRAFAIDPPDFYPGINAATLALLSGHRELARQLARKVLKICKTKLQPQPGGEVYWLRASLAEALLILQQREEAKEAYRQTAAVENVSLRELCSTRRQARLLANHLFGRPELFDECFSIPKVVIFSGHMMDSVNRSARRFAATDEPAIRSAIEKQLEQLNAGIAFSSAACGSDILLLEAMLDRKGTVHVVLPWPKEQFIKTSVEHAEGDWVARFNRVVDRAASVRVLGELQMPESAIGLEYCNLTMIGLARLYAQSLDLEIAPLAVWDRMHGDPGGTGSFVRYWQTHGLSPTVITPPVSEAKYTVKAANSYREFERVEEHFQSSGGSSFRYELKAIIFADVVSYSQLSETAVRNFVAHFSQRVSCLIAETSHPPINVNTWGDGFFFAFDEVEQAGCFALDLRDLVVTTDWTQFGLPEKLNIRIAVHAGPVYVTFDPITRQTTFTGAHVVRAARIEPVAQRGEIFATEEFAALSAAEEIKGFRCDFVGTTDLPKGYGSFRLYILTRRRSPVV